MSLPAADPATRSPSRRVLRWSAGGCAGAFVALAVWVGAGGGWLPGERRALVELHAGGSYEEGLTRLADLTDLLPLAIVAGVVALGLGWRRRWADLAYGAAVVGVVWAVNPVLKDLFARSRPDLWPAPMELSEHSFPSGHAANTAALAVALVLACRSTRTRRIVAAAGVVGVVAVGLGQLALGVHHPSDVLAGCLWAGAWAALVWSVRPAPPPSGPPPRRGSANSSRS